METDKKSTVERNVATGDILVDGEKKAITVITEKDDRGVVAFNDNPNAVVTNMDITGPKGRAMVTRTLASCNHRTRDVVGRVLRVIGFVAHNACVIDNKTGEVIDRQRAVLVLSNGEYVSTMSSGVIRTLSFLASSMNQGAWDPPLNLMIMSHPGANGTSYCDMVELDDDQVAEYEAKQRKGK